MKNLLIILTTIFIVASGCGPDSDRVITTSEIISDTLYVDCDSIFNAKGYYAKHIIFDSNNENETQNNSIFILGRDSNEIIYDSIYSKVQDIQFIDFNNDGVKDILIQNTSDVRSNWTYYLYLSNLNSTRFNRVKGFSNIRNPKVISGMNIIESYVNSGTNYHEFLKIINNESIYKYNILVYDNHDEESKNSYINAINKIKQEQIEISNNDSIHGKEKSTSHKNDGTYTYDIALAEWGGKSLGSTCTVIIKGDSITVLNDGSLSGTKGETIEEGTLMIHKKTGKWIISHSNSDIDAEEVGGCSDGPLEIDIKNKKLWLC